MFIQLLTSPALQGDPAAPVITYPTPGLVVDYAEDDTASVVTILWTGNPSPSYTLTGVDAALFEMVGDEFQWVSQPNYDDPQDSNGDNVYDVTVVADNGQGSFGVSFAVRVTNVVDLPPTITFPTASPVQVPSGRAVAFNARSLDDASSRTWSITGGADAALFSVVGSTGRVSFLASPDYASPADFNADNDYELTIQVETAAGTDTQAVVVRVVDQQPSKPSFGTIFVEAAPSQPVVFDTSAPPAFDAGYGS